jgi:hypothetical protein
LHNVPYSFPYVAYLKITIPEPPLPPIAIGEVSFAAP